MIHPGEWWRTASIYDLVLLHHEKRLCLLLALDLGGARWALVQTKWVAIFPLMAVSENNLEKRELATSGGHQRGFIYSWLWCKMRVVENGKWLQRS